MAEENFDQDQSTGAGAAPGNKGTGGVKSQARQAAGDLRAAAEAKAHELRSVAEQKAEEYRRKGEEALDEAKVRVRTLHEDGEAYVRENPTRAVLAALGAGFILGLIYRK